MGVPPSKWLFSRLTLFAHVIERYSNSSANALSFCGVFGVVCL